ncbi:TPA: hypothetical protein ONA42_001205 [Pseudomonas aeruginosa]|uniref:hypothetical protein n=1 Tax=Pseudomonas aeruginosa TaxID=287 RepID=UPI0002296F59|nr:hypothetical protein [Pseudomonas aeruginosa]AEO73817.1 hypothetical protein PAM18_1330 [Pseudomonas aeruginosa M18]HCR1245163.1 hypothetical protein [Pseudomonas aeruginosa]HCR1432754.1 hypothetical protein [Pseudomonas aeruginosa]
MTESKIQMDQIRSTSATVTDENIRAGSQKKSSLSPAEGLQGASPDATCTCPSGDGYLVHPCPAHPAPVEQAGGDEREEFEALIYACKNLAQITSSDGSGHADIAMAVLRMAGVGDDERERLVNEWKAARAWKPSPGQAEKAEAERPEVVGVRYEDGTILSAEDCGTALEVCAKVQTPLMTVAQHERIAASRWERAMDLMGDHVARISDKLTAERDAALAEVERLTGVCASLDSEKREMEHKRDAIIAMRDAAMDRVSELEKQEPFYYFADCDDSDYSHLFNTRSDALTQVADHGGSVVELFRLPVAQAQHSVPDSYRLIRLEHFAAIKAQLNPEQVDAYRGRNIYDEDKVYANWNACRSALDEIKDVFQQIDWDAENELAELPAAAPGKEGV